jgi:hypothetical protein
MGANHPATSKIWIWAAALLLALVACDQTSPRKSLVPPNRPNLVQPQPPTVAVPSSASVELARHYEAVQSDLLTRGLMRTDGGGPDTLFTADDLARNFEQIAFYDEYSRSVPAGVESGTLTRWEGPVRIRAEFGGSVSKDQRRKDRAAIDKYAGRLARVTGHPVSAVPTRPNFNVFIAGKDDSDFVQQRLRDLIPGISQSDLELFSDPPRSFYCLVIGIAGATDPYVYKRAVAVIRAEHPDLVRQACIHEELAQGLGLPNDSPQARPSIFNDDDEFALLTSHDEMLLKMLYDPRLSPGMTAQEARPVTRIIARELMGQEL